MNWIQFWCRGGFIMLIYSIVITLSLIILKEGRGVRIFSHPVPIPYSEPSRSADDSVQFLIQNVTDGSYHFGYDIHSDEVRSYREEKRDSLGRVSGRYGYVDPDGVLRVVEYLADSQGFRSRTVEAYNPNPFLMDYSGVPVIGPIPKPLPENYSYELTREDYF